jgi:TonB family protein
MAKLSFRLACLLALAIGATGLSAQDVEVDSFTIPRPSELPAPTYPSRPLSYGGEGLVEITFMVGEDGKAFDPVISRYAGDEAFHDAALEALAKAEFVPAMQSGEPIVGSARLRYEFTLTEASSSASKSFTSLFGRFQRALQGDDRKKIDDLLALLEREGAANHYENAFLNLARYNYAVRFGDEREQLEYLDGALSEQVSVDDPVYLEADVVRELRRALLQLQLRTNRFPEALDTYALMQADGDDEAVAFFAEAIEAVHAVESDGTQYLIPLSLNAGGSAWIDLYKHHFALTGGAGGLSEAKLRCEKQYVAFAVERDIAYDVPSEWGKCTLEIVGDADASLALLQR